MNLFTPFSLGQIKCQNRIGMAAMSRQRCDNLQMIPTNLIQTYYSQRSSAGFIITEGLPLSNQSIAQPGSCGIFNIQQSQAWQNIVKELHQKGTKVIAQLWHCGRVTNLVNEPFAPSAIKIKNSKYNTPKEMTQDDIYQVIEQYQECSQYIKLANFDGIEIQASSGYLLDSFLKSSANKRTDQYGGSIQNRCRIILEILDKIIEVFDSQKIGVKISPITRQYDSYDPNPKELYTYLLKEFNERNIGFIEIRDDDYPDNFLDYGYPSSKSDIQNVFEFMRPLFKGTIIGNGKLTPESATQLIEKGLIDAVTFGRLYIANPNLVEKIMKNQEFNQLDTTTLLSQGPKGYIDYE